MAASTSSSSLLGSLLSEDEEDNLVGMLRRAFADFGFWSNNNSTVDYDDESDVFVDSQEEYASDDNNNAANGRKSSNSANNNDYFFYDNEENTVKCRPSRHSQRGNNENVHDRQNASKSKKSNEKKLSNNNTNGRATATTKKKLPCTMTNCLQVLKNHRFVIAQTRYGTEHDWNIPSKQVEYETLVATDTTLTKLAKRYVKNRNFGRIMVEPLHPHQQQQQQRHLRSSPGDDTYVHFNDVNKSSKSSIGSSNYEERLQQASDELMSIGFSVRHVHPGDGWAFQLVKKLHYYFDE